LCCGRILCCRYKVRGRKLRAWKSSRTFQVSFSFSCDDLRFSTCKKHSACVASSHWLNVYPPQTVSAMPAAQWSFRDQGRGCFDSFHSEDPTRRKRQPKPSSSATTKSPGMHDNNSEQPEWRPMAAPWH
jgi:hypothetical protein